jgi:hypothetical protein
MKLRSKTMTLTKTSDLISTTIKGLGTIIDVLGIPGTVDCKYLVDFDNDLQANQYKKDNYVPQIVIDVYNM